MVWGAGFLVTEGFRSLLGKTGNYMISGINGFPKQLLETIARENPDVLVIDTSAPEFDAALPGKIKNMTNSPVIILLLGTISHNEFQRYSKAGIENLLLKNASGEEILNAMEAAVSSRKHYSSEILEMVLDSMVPNVHADAINQLTPSEKEVVRLIAGGMTTKQIAAWRNTSFHTVTTHRKNIFRKLSVSNVSELAMKVIKSGWFDNIEYYI